MLPEYIAQTTAMPLGTLPEGSKRYLTGFGLAHEDPLSLVGAPRDVGAEVLSRSNPLLKGPLEWITGESFFQRGPMGGRPLEQMDPTLGRIGANIRQLTTGEETKYPEPVGGTGLEHAIANSPLSRLSTTLRTITDPRKYESPGAALGLGANLLTGFRVTDVSPGAQRAHMRQASQSFAEQLGARRMQLMNFPEEQIQRLAQEDPERARMAVALKNLWNKLARESRERRKREARHQ